MTDADPRCIPSVVRHRHLRARLEAVVALALAASITTTPLVLRAQTGGSTTLAQSLFDDGKRLMAEKKFDQACPKLAESYRLDPAGGTLLNLAVCNEEWGKIASAWSEFKDAVSLSRKEGDLKREQFAREHAAALEPKLSRLTLNVAAGTNTAGIEIQLDAAKLGAAALGNAFPVDPGMHTITVTQPGKKPWTTTVEVGTAADQKIVEIPVLEIDLAKPADAPPPPDHTAAYIVTTSGIVLIGVGAFSGIEALSKWSTRNDNCKTDTTCLPAGVSAASSAKGWATASDVFFGVGIVATVIGGYMLLSDPSTPSDMPASTPSPAPAAVSHLDVHPSISSQFTGLTLTGSF